MEIGLTAPRTTSGSPLLMPPVRPPALLVPWCQRPSSRPVMTSCTADPRRRVCSKPRPNSTPLTALMETIACASAPSRRRSHCTWLPRPSGTPVATTSKTPPSVSPADRASSMAATMRASAAASRQRRGLASASSRERGGASGSAATSPTATVWLQTSMPSSPRKARQTAPAATRIVVSRAEARSRTSRTSSKSYLTAPGQVGVAGPDARHGARPLVAVGGQGHQLGGLLVAQALDLHHAGPVGPVAVGHLEQDRRAQRPAVPDTRQDRGPILLDGHAGAPAVAALAAGEVGRDRVGAHRHARRQALQDHPQRLAVRLPRGQEAEGHAAGERSASSSRSRIRSSGGSCPVHSLKAAAPWCSSISSPFIVAAAPAALASRSRRVSRGV